MGTARYGGKLGDDTSYRVYAKGFARDRFPDLTGRDGLDDLNSGEAGFRVDRSFAAGQELLVEGSTFRGRVGDQLTTGTLTAPFQRVDDVVQRVKGANMLVRWQGKSETGSSSTVQGYLDYSDFRLGEFSESRHTLDLYTQHRMPIGPRNDVIVGAGYRLSRDSIVPIEAVNFDQTGLDSCLYSAFAQDEVVLLPERLRLTLGARFEHNSYTGREFQPNARMLCVDARAGALVLGIGFPRCTHPRAV